MYISTNARSANAYRRQSIESDVSHASPHRLVEMLFEGAIVSIRAAHFALEHGDIKTKGEKLGKAIRIIEEGLKSNLNLQSGGQLAANLDSVYDYCILRMTQANVRNDGAALGEVVNVLSVILDGWKSIAEQQAPQE